MQGERGTAIDTKDKIERLVVLMHCDILLPVRERHKYFCNVPIEVEVDQLHVFRNLNFDRGMGVCLDKHHDIHNQSWLVSLIQKHP